MTRVLHLLTGRAGEASAALAALVADTAAHEPGDHAVALLGGASLRSAADHAGLTGYALLPEPAGLTMLAPKLNTSFARLIKQADRIDAWTPQACEHARRAGGRHIQPRFAPAALVQLAKRYTDTRRLDACDRDAVRQSWDVSDQERVIALLGQTPTQGHTPHAALAMLMAQDTLDCRTAQPPGQNDRPPIHIRLLIHPNHDHRADAQTTLAHSGHTRLLVQEPRLTAPWLILPACDAAITPPSRCGTQSLSTFWADNAGLPNLTPHSDRPRDIARAIIEWIDETDASASQSDRMIQSA